MIIFSIIELLEKIHFKVLNTITVTGTGCHDGSGGSSCCSSSNKCGVGEGDCDVDDDCQADLKCGTDNCRLGENGFPSFYDCCYVPTPPTTTPQGL